MNCSNEVSFFSDRGPARLKAAKALAVIVVACVWASAAHGGLLSMVAAEHLPDSGYDLGSTIGIILPAAGITNLWHGQVFLAEQGGPLEMITVRVSRAPSSNEPLLVRLHALSGNLPGDLLDSRSVPAAAVPTSTTNVMVNFSGSPATLVAGQSYALVLGVTVPQESPGRFAWSGVWGDGSAASPDPYLQGYMVQSNNGGSSFFRTPNSDLGFRVMVVPEPTSLGLLVLGAAAMVARGRRHS